MNKYQAINKFWNQFGVKAYDETTVPDDVELPYITYSVSTSDFDNMVVGSASIWDRSTSWNRVTEIEQSINNVMSKGGSMISYDGGGLWIVKGNPWSQRLSNDSNRDIRRIVLSVTMEFME